MSSLPDPTRRPPARRGVLAAAAALLEPKARAVGLPGALLKSEAELDDWLTKVRERIAKALGDQIDGVPVNFTGGFIAT